MVAISGGSRAKALPTIVGGVHTLRFLLEDPAFDVVGAWVQREQNIGRTARPGVCSFLDLPMISAAGSFA